MPEGNICAHPAAHPKVESQVSTPSIPSSYFKAMARQSSQHSAGNGHVWSDEIKLKLLPKGLSCVRIYEQHQTTMQRYVHTHRAMSMHYP